MNIFKKIYRFFDLFEDKIRGKLSHRPILYAIVGSFGIVLIWRGIWHIADEINMSSWVSLGLGIAISLATGLMVSFFIGEKIIISGIRKEKRIDEKAEEDIKREGVALMEMQKELEEIKEDLEEIKNN